MMYSNIKKAKGGVCALKTITGRNGLKNHWCTHEQIKSCWFHFQTNCIIDIGRHTTSWNLPLQLIICWLQMWRNVSSAVLTRTLTSSLPWIKYIYIYLCLSVAKLRGKAAQTITVNWMNITRRYTCLQCI